ncbi:MAG: hypothetical protein ABIN95_09275 [Mucilaginibacter sp.]
MLLLIAVTYTASAQSLLLKTGLGLSIPSGSDAGLAAGSWQKGYYYDKEGHKVTGLLKNYLPDPGFLGRGDNLSFKSDSNAKKQTIAAREISSFVINYENGLRDSFIITQSPLLTKRPIVRLLINNSVKLYGLLYTFSSVPVPTFNPQGQLAAGGGFSRHGTKEEYYYGVDANNVAQVNSTNFYAAINQVMGDKPKIIEGVKAGKYTVAKLDKLIDYYNLDADNHVTWHQGHYYDTTGNMISGFFAKNILNGFVAGSEGEKILFRTSPAAETKKLDYHNLRSFIVTYGERRDSFVVSKDLKFAATPFLRVLTNQPLKLYNISMELYKGKIYDKYYVGQTPDDVTEITSKNFKTAMKEVMADSPGFLRMLEKKQVGYDERDLIFTYLKTGIWPQPTVANY